MRTKILVSILCAGLLVYSLTGCGLKMPEESASTPSGSTAGSPNEGNETELATFTGIVSTIGADKMTINLVSQSEAGSADTAGSIRVGSLLYVISGGTRSFAPSDKTAVLFANHGYTEGSTGDIVKGDFLAVVLRGDTAVVIIDGGLAYASETEGEQPSVEPTDNEVSPSPGIPDTTEPARYIVTTDELKIRSGPGTEYSALGILDTGAIVTGTVTDGWLKFTYDGKTAYCSADYLEISTTPEGVPDSSESKTYKTTDNVLARNGPGTTNTILGTLEKGTEITGTVLGGWLKFTYNDEIAYCSAAYLTLG